VLTEVASARIATPIEIESTELQGGGKGLTTYEQQINFPNPWPGGTWRLRDIMDYELLVSGAALETVSKYHQELLRGVATMATQAVQTADPAVYWRIPLDGQRDPVVATRLAALLLEHGVEVRWHADKKLFLIPTAQPYGRFVDEMMGIQRYPEVRPAPNSGILEPYDVAAWSLPLMMGVKAERVSITPDVQNSSQKLETVTWPTGGLTNVSGKYFSIADHQNNVFALANAMQGAGGQVYLAQPKVGESPEFIFASHAQLAANAEKFHLQLVPCPGLPQDTTQLRQPRVGLYKPYIPSHDEGWTRFLLEQYGFKLKNIENKEMRAGNLNNAYDVIILPDSTREVIVEGKESRGGYFEEMPPEYVGGIGKEGLHALRDFVDKGGTLITLANASDVIYGEEFNLPVRNALAAGGAGGRGAAPAGASDFNIPGSLLRVYIDTNHPVGAGMPHEIAAFVDSPIAFQTSAPPPDIQRSVIAWYPDDAKDILVSGYAHGAERLQRKAAIVSFTRGKGKIVMFGFRVQHRAQTEGTFQLLFNAIFWGGM
jgi:hypothetical protein